MTYGTVERKVLGAMLILADDGLNLKSSMKRIANVMGYKEAGGAISFAIQALAMKRAININDKGDYTVLL